MFRVQNTILSTEIATAKFACDISRCKGACCVIGDAGAPVSKGEIPVLKRAWKLLKDELRPEAVAAVEKDGVIIHRGGSNYEINCADNKECIFVKYDEQGVAHCAIQQAFYEGRFDWEKPISCHLFPIRLQRFDDVDFANYEPMPVFCAFACEKGEREDIYLSEFLKKPLVRRYGEEWYEEFEEACSEIRSMVK